MDAKKSIKDFVFKERKFGIQHIFAIILIISFVIFKVYESKQECPYSYIIKISNKEPEKICYKDLFSWVGDKQRINKMGERQFYEEQQKQKTYNLSSLLNVSS